MTSRDREKSYSKNKKLKNHENSNISLMVRDTVVQCIQQKFRNYHPQLLFQGTYDVTWPGKKLFKKWKVKKSQKFKYQLNGERYGGAMYKKKVSELPTATFVLRYLWRHMTGKKVIQKLKIIFLNFLLVVVFLNHESEWIFFVLLCFIEALKFVEIPIAAYNNSLCF